MIAALHFSRHKSLGVTIRTNSLFHRKYGLGAPWRFAVLIRVFALCSSGASNASAEEFIGKFEPKLAPNKDDLDHVIFKPFRDLSKVQFAKRPESDATITAGRLYTRRRTRPRSCPCWSNPKGSRLTFTPTSI